MKRNYVAPTITLCCMTADVIRTSVAVAEIPETAVDFLAGWLN